MSLKEILEKNPELTLEDLQALQKEYDRRFVNQKFETGFEKVEHTYAHMGKLLGRLASYVEAMEEGREVSAEDIKTKVIPDLLVYSAWLADSFGVSMEQAYLRRFVDNMKRLYADKIPAEEMEGIQQTIRKKLWE
jgi:hypothetical protein